MKPDNLSNQPQAIAPQSPAAQQPGATNQPMASVQGVQQTAATNIVRGQIDSIYGQNQQSIETTSVYDRTHQTRTQPTADQWNQYHSAWQDYYQKYYERYYVGHVHQARQAILNEQQAASQQISQPIGSSSRQNDESISQNEALAELRDQIREKVGEKVEVVRKSRHFVPILAALSVMVMFGFLQYNQVLVANVKAYVSPGNIDPANIIVDPSLSTSVDAELTNLIIPKINVDAPVDYNATPDNDSQMAAMNNGLAYFGIRGANAKPGEVGNTAVAGHSSNDVFAAGAYKFIFAQLEKIGKDDVIYANYKGTRYTYVVTRTEVVKPSEIDKLVYDTDKPMLTLITCTPLGTAEKRLLVTAEQVSPDPKSASKPDSSQESTSSDTAEMAGTSPTLLQRLFGAR
jgi:sortase A